MGDPGARVVLDGIAKRFGATVAAEDIRLRIEPGELLTLLGPSGCGKTTTLRIVAGLEVPTAGRVLIGQEDVTDLPPYARDVSMVFQSYALFPHLTVFDNVAYGLRITKRPAAEVARAVDEALALRPKVLLFDEPLSNLDAKLRRRMRGEIRALQQRLGITALYVTHDQAEALAISDRIAVMHRGRIHQVGRATDVYTRPATRFVADFIGEANFLAARIVAVDGDARRVEVGPLTLTVAGGPGAPGPATLVVRPETIAIRPRHPGERAAEALAGEVERAAYLGTAGEYTVGTALGPLAVTDPVMADGLLPPGTPVWLRFAPRGMALLPDREDIGMMAPG
ncbi:MAG TPA: ABC transporter ATP-binding protein [Methylomirabilota bacterium]|nr:ABC transporter ATP-binding protein [Methylomirabilota bacterium]